MSDDDKTPMLNPSKPESHKKKKKKKKKQQIDIADLEQELKTDVEVKSVEVEAPAIATTTNESSNDDNDNSTKETKVDEETVNVDDDNEPPPPVERPSEEQIAKMHGTFEPFWARALGDFTAQEEGDLTFRYAQLMEVVDMQENGWWCARIQERIGWVPSNHLERVDPLEIFLTKIGLLKLYGKFVEEDVDIETLKLLNEEDLVRLGIKLGPRKALLSALADASKVRRLSAPRDISHQEVKRTLSVAMRTGEEPENTRLTKDRERTIPGGRVRTSQFLTKKPTEATDEDFVNAAVYLKVIIPEQNLYKILLFEGNMKVKDCLPKIANRLTKKLKKSPNSYGLYVPGAHSDVLMESQKLLGVYKLPNMSCVLLKQKPRRGLFGKHK